MEKEVTLNRREQTRLVVLNKVLEKAWTAQQASEGLGLSVRHVRRLLAAYREEGAQALAHGNRGQRPKHALDEGVKEQVVELARSKYAGCNQQHLTELLFEREGIELSRSSVRRVLREAGIATVRKRRAPRRRSRRERSVQEGMLVQVDGSTHHWLGERRPKLCLIAAVDDATGKVLAAVFRPEEDSIGYFQLLEQVVRGHGIPLSLYHDRHSIFELSQPAVRSIEQELEGSRPLTQFGRLLAELGIQSITSYSPQGRGRIERLWGSLQDRLVAELRLAGAATIEQANRVVEEFLPRYNQRFAVPAAQPGSAFITPAKDWPLGQVFCFKHERTVGCDNVVSFLHQPIQVLPCHGRTSYARAKVQVHLHLDGRLELFYQARPLLTRPAPPAVPSLIAVAPVPPLDPLPPASICSRTPAPDHPWRGIYRAPSTPAVTKSQNT
jgi:transposase